MTQKRSRSKWPEEDVSLIRKAQSGDQKAVTKVIEQYQFLARSFSAKFRGNSLYNHHDIEDLYAEAVESILKSIRIYGRYTDDDGIPYPFWRTVWLMIRGDAQHKRRKRAYRQSKEFITKTGDIFYAKSEMLDKNFEFMSEREGVEERKIYNKAWDIAKECLNEQQWITWRLYYGRDMTEAEIARELNITRQGINVRLMACRKKVRKGFRSEGYRFENKD